MVFSSVEFIFRFLPVFLIAYFVSPEKYRNLVLLIASLFFYAYGKPVYLLLMLASIFVNYLIAGQISKSQSNLTSRAKAWLILSLIYNFGVLFIFKYLGFALRITDSIIGTDLAKGAEFLLPLGISFYTFQIVSYMIDVYRGRIGYEADIVRFATFVTMFPQLIAGPIVNYPEVSLHLRERRASFADVEEGSIYFVLGLASKVLLANKIASLWNAVQTIGPLGINAPVAWLGSWGFSMQIYFDFFGYSLMAIGLGRMLGFELPQNFDNPYCVKSATDFWRRWHMTLGRWFREYLYIPLGGNRAGKGRMVFNLFMVWFCTGLWHGADWNFIIWGLGFFVILMIEKFFTLKFLEKSKLIGHLYMLVLIPVSWTIFNISDLKVLIQYLCKMFFIPVAGSVDAGYEKFYSLLGTYWWMLAICALCCTPLPGIITEKYKGKAWYKLVLLALFWLSVYEIIQGSDNPFLYFRF